MRWHVIITLMKNSVPSSAGRKKERITMFIAGCQNCGKSYYISQFIRLYKTLRPERSVYLVTGLSEKDAHFEGLGMWKIQLEAVPSLTLEHLRKVEADAPKDR